MTIAVALALLLSLAPPAHLSPAAPAADEALFRTGVAFADFVAAARSRPRELDGQHERAHVPADLRRRFAAVPGRWHLLVVAEAWCLDSANTVPYLARLAEQAPNVELRMVARRSAGRSWTPTAPPTGAPRRPRLSCSTRGSARPALRRAAGAARRVVGQDGASISSAELHARVASWDDWDRGDTTMAEVVGLIGPAAGRASR